MLINTNFNKEYVCDSCLIRVHLETEKGTYALREVFRGRK